MGLPYSMIQLPLLLSKFLVVVLCLMAYRWIPQVLAFAGSTANDALIGCTVLTHRLRLVAQEVCKVDNQMVSNVNHHAQQQHYHVY